MGHIPQNAKWYLADIVIELKIEDEPHNVIHINTVLVRASSPQRAYTRALKLGQEAEHEYKNTDGKMVQCIFRGLRDLIVIYNDLRSGAELIYQEQIGQSEEQIARLISPKNELEVFVERRKPSKKEPNYMPESVMEMLKEMGFDENDMYR